MVPVPRSLGTDLDGDGYVDGFEYVDCRRATPEQFGVARSFTLPEPDPVVSTEVCLHGVGSVTYRTAGYRYRTNVAQREDYSSIDIEEQINKASAFRGTRY